MSPFFCPHNFRNLSLSLGKAGDPMTSCICLSLQRSATCMVPLYIGFLLVLVLLILECAALQLQVPGSQLRQLQLRKVFMRLSENMPESLKALYCLVWSSLLVFHKLVRSRQKLELRLLCCVLANLLTPNLEQLAKVLRILPSMSTNFIEEYQQLNQMLTRQVIINDRITPSFSQLQATSLAECLIQVGLSLIKRIQRESTLGIIIIIVVIVKGLFLLWL